MTAGASGCVLVLAYLESIRLPAVLSVAALELKTNMTFE